MKRSKWRFIQNFTWKKNWCLDKKNKFRQKFETANPLLDNPHK